MRRRSVGRNAADYVPTLKLELVRRALLYRESATAIVKLRVESDYHEHANGRR